jgi:hypothetical protein
LRWDTTPTPTLSAADKEVLVLPKAIQSVPLVLRNVETTLPTRRMRRILRGK